MITMSAPDVSAEELALVEQVLRSSSLSGGPMVQAFEAEWCARLGGAHAVAVSSGTSGLHVSLIAAGVQAGDFVITSPFSFVASANAALFQRAVPIFVDVDPVTMNIDASAVDEAARALARGGDEARRWLPRRIPGDLSGNGKRGRVKAILPVHVFGQPATMRPLLDTAGRHDIAVIEDACEAVGATHEGERAGTFGAAAVFAFYPNKQMTTGEGGMVVTRDPEWARLMRSLRNQGRDDDATWLRHVRLGYNYRLDEMSAALGLGQLRRLDELLAARERVARGYIDRLKDIDAVTLPRIVSATTRMSWFVFVIRLAADVDRDAVIAALEADGVPSRPYFSPIHLQPFYRETFGYTDGDFPRTEAAGRSSLALPFHTRLTDGELDFVTERLSHAIARCRRSARPSLASTAASSAGPVQTDGTSAIVDVWTTETVAPLDAVPLNHRVAGRRLDDVALDALLGRPPFALDNAVAERLIANRRVLVTGAGGSIGSELCQQIARLAPQSLIMCDRYENGLHAVATQLADASFVQPVIGDVTDAARMSALFDRTRPELVFHAAAHKHVPLMEDCPSEAVKNNVTGTRVVAELAARTGTSRFVLVSTDKAVRPTSIMGATKRAAELLVRSIAGDEATRGTQTAFVAVRFGNVLGSNGSVVPAFLRQMGTGGPVAVTHPEVRRYFMLIPEAVQLMLHAAALAGKPDAGSTTFVLNLGGQIKIVDLARNLMRLAGLTPDADIPIVFTGLRQGEKLSEELIFDEEEEARESGVPEILLVADRRPRAAADLAAAVARLEALAARGDDGRVVSALCELEPSFTPGGVWDVASAT